MGDKEEGRESEVSFDCFVWKKLREKKERKRKEKERKENKEKEKRKMEKGREMFLVA